MIGAATARVAALAAAQGLTLVAGEGRSLVGGCVGNVRRFETEQGVSLVAKLGHRQDTGLEIEAAMLRDLARLSELPVPAILAAEADVLLMQWLPGGIGARHAELHAADLLAALHRVTAERFGYAYATRIGGLPQPNPWTASWPEFFGEYRLAHMARLAAAAGQLESALLQRVEGLAGRLAGMLPAAPPVALLHGDLWSGNVLSRLDRVTGVLDPALYFGDAEVELAFITMFATFGPRFFGRYQEHRNVDAGFAERRDLYNLYPLLVHATLFGGGYVEDVARTLGRYE